MPTAEQEELRQLARDFAEQELAPSAPARDEAGVFDVEVFQQLAEVGFLGLRTPEDFGGLDLDLVTWVGILEELGRADAGVATSVAAQTGPLVEIIRRAAPESVCADLLPQFAAGTLIGAVSFGDPLGTPAAGDALRISQTGGSGVRLAGAHRWIVNGGACGLVAVLGDAGTDGGDTGSDGGEVATGPDGGKVGEDAAPGAGGEQSSVAFLVEPSLENLMVTTETGALGLRSSGMATLTASGAEVADAWPLGDDGSPRGVRRIADSLSRLGVAAISVGIGAAAFDHATSYALERRQFGRAIGEFGAIREKLARVAVALSGARELTASAARLLDPSQDGDPAEVLEAEAATMIAKIAASEAAALAADESVQIFGGYGYMRHYPVERSMRDAKVMQLITGTNMTLREKVAHRVLIAAHGGD